MRQTLLLAAASILLSIPSAAQTHERVDLNSAGQPGNATALYADMSEDARFVVLSSKATNMGGAPLAGAYEMYLRDRTLGTTIAVTSTTSFAQDSRLDFFPPCISRDGSIIAYMRGGPPSSAATAFVYERATGVTTPLVLPGLVDVRITGLDRTGTFASVLARTAPSAELRAYRVHLATGAVVLCSRSMTGAPVAGGAADIDETGNVVAFSSSAPNIVPNDAVNSLDTFVFDIPAQVMTCASVDAGGIPAQGALSRLAGNGQFVSFTRSDSVLVRDLQLQSTLVASLTTHNVPITVYAFKRGALAPDGSMAAFVSPYPTTSIDNNGSPDVYVRDFVMSTLIPATKDTSYPLDFQEADRFSADGRSLLYMAVTIPTAQGSGQFLGVFLAEYGPRCSTSNYCTSLPSSTGAPATIGAQGDASRELNNLVIAGVGLPDGAIAMLASGAVAVDPGMPFGNGLLCIGGGMVRHGVHVASGGVILDHQDMSSPEYAGVNPGDTRHYQIFYRDPAAGGANFNTTDAVSVTYCW